MNRQQEFCKLFLKILISLFVYLNSLSLSYICVLDLMVDLRIHCNLIQFSCSVVSNSLRPHGLQHSRLPCPLGLTGLIYLQSQDWFDLLVGTLKNLLQYHTSKTLILRHSTFFTVQFSHSYLTTVKAIALTTWTFVQDLCLCFLICSLGWSQLFFQGAIVF